MDDASQWKLYGEVHTGLNVSEADMTNKWNEVELNTFIATAVKIEWLDNNDYCWGLVRPL
jgi:hypothetical protein